MTISAAYKLLCLLLISVGQYGPRNVSSFVQNFHNGYCRSCRSGDTVAVNSHNYRTENRRNDHGRSYNIPQYSISALPMKDSDVTSAGTVTIENTQQNAQQNKGEKGIDSTNKQDKQKEQKEEFIDLPALEIIEFEGILNFRSALPGTGLPIYRCAALDNATATDTRRLLSTESMEWDAERCVHACFLVILGLFDFVCKILVQLFATSSYHATVFYTYNCCCICYTALHSSVLCFCIVLHFSVVHCSILYCIVLYFIILFLIILYCTALFCTVLIYHYSIHRTSVSTYDTHFQIRTFTPALTHPYLHINTFSDIIF